MTIDPQIHHVRAHRRLHHVDDDVAGVDQHPLAGLLAFDADDRRAGLLELVADVVRERPDLPVRIGARDDEGVGDGGELADVEDRDVVRLDVLEGGDGDFRELGAGHPRGCPFQAA